jgi:plasmid stabilization system protein ParE
MPLRVLYLEQAAKDAVWMLYYYDVVFPEGARNGHNRFRKSLKLLAVNPHLGRPLEKKPLRSFSVLGTPFTLVYRENGETLEIIRILDQRSGAYLAALLGKP